MKTAGMFYFYDYSLAFALVSETTTAFGLHSNSGPDIDLVTTKTCQVYAIKEN